MSEQKVGANSPIGVFDSGTGGLTVVRHPTRATNAAMRAVKVTG
ncbi:MAG TPA: hypothetical protein PK300_09195 [Bacillota bacterium]|nr:hypothetical protein [Bacillota bacterium]HPU62289.1 hypothetical protein [Bacillota bacterium]HQD86026.1 hypothetical protein [Bacillota bacterium]